RRDAKSTPRGDSVSADATGGDLLFEHLEGKAKAAVEFLAAELALLLLGIVEIEDVNDIELKIGQALLELLGKRDGCEGVAAVGKVAGLGADDQLLARNDGFGKHAADNALAALLAVDDGGIHKVDAPGNGRAERGGIAFVGGGI